MDETDTTVETAPYECDPCDDRFETRAELRDHVWEVHEMDGDITTWHLSTTLVVNLPGASDTGSQRRVSGRF